MNTVNLTKVITGPETRWSCTNTWELKPINGGALQYSVSLIIPKSDTAIEEKAKVAIQVAYQEDERKQKGRGKMTSFWTLLRHPFVMAHLWAVRPVLNLTSQLLRMMISWHKGG